MHTRETYSPSQTFSKSSKKRTKPFEKLSTPFLGGGEKEKEREKQLQLHLHHRSNRIKSNHDRGTAIPISTSAPFSTFFLPLLRNTRQDVSRGQCRAPFLGGGGSLSELRVPFMHQKTSSDQQTGSTIASYPFLGARTRLGLNGKPSETRERNRDTYNIQVMRRDSTLPASQ